MLRVNIRTPLKVIFGTKNIIGGVFSLSTQYVSQLLTVLNRKLNKTVILTCRCSMCIENESTGKYTCSHAPYTRFTSVDFVLLHPYQYEIEIRHYFGESLRDIRACASHHHEYFGLPVNKVI